MKYNHEEEDPKTKPRQCTESTPLLLPISSSSTAIKTDDNKESTVKAHLNDAWDTITLAIPIFLANVSWIGMKTIDTALLGHVSSDALTAAALSDLWTMCTAVLIQGRVLRILCTQAIGAGNMKLAGVYLQISYFILFSLSFFVILSWWYTSKIWILFGESEEISNMAGYYAQTLSFSIPAQVANSQLTQFFASQRIMYPEVQSAVMALICNFIFGLEFVLGIPFSSYAFGFKACSIVTAITVYFQFLTLWFVYCFIKKLHQNAWGGWSLSEITFSRVKTFCGLYFPAALSMSSDFWRMACIGAIAATLGDLEVGLFNMSYRIIWIVLTLVVAVASAASIKIGTKLGSADVNGARDSAFIGVFISFILLLMLSILFSFKIKALGSLFSNDEQLLEMLEQCKWPFIATLFFMNLAVAIEQVPISMGRTSIVFWMGFFASWFGQVPGAFFLTRYWRNDLYGLYTGVAIGYFMLVFLYGAIVLNSDWKYYSDLAIERSEVSK